MKKVFIVLLFISYSAFGQDTYTKEFTFSVDNDLFVSYVNDQYYSSGLFFTYRFLDTKKSKEEKVIKHRSLEHKIFTPFKSIIKEKEEHDRPFAGLLYVSFGSMKVNKNRLKKTNFQVGMMGPAAIGKEFQEFIHNIYGFLEPIGWKYQITNSPILNYSVDITKKLVKLKRKYSDSYYSYGLSVGTIHTHLMASLEGRIGFKELASFDRSIAFRTNLDSEHKRQVESFLHWKVKNKIVVYDATLQGSLFNNSSPVTFSPNRLQLSFELGYYFTAKSWNLGYKIIYNTNERPNLVNDGGHVYGTVSISKLFN